MTTQLPNTEYTLEDLHEIAYRGSYDDMQRSLARALLAAYEQEPVAYIFKHPSGRLFWSLSDESTKNHKDVFPVYTRPAPSIPAVPDEVMRCLGFFASVIKSGESWTSVCQHEYDTAKEACRAAMLNGGKS